ncbi:MAG TPA: ribonuclease HII [Candidatus Yonathbacteria bacterium]|nr:ribonuclease HII [Candidatus Yonathbacteria bacterium]
MRSRHKYIIGVDEVGRGPLAGPVAVGVVKFKAESQKVITKWGIGFKDSKKLSANGREAWLVKIDEAMSEGWLEYAVAFVSPSVIDKKGLSYAIRTAMEKALSEIEHDVNKTKVLLDGALHAPSHYPHQETIIKGDEKELSIALASIVAKVARDKKMVALAKKFPEYGFEKHKGYGTRAHYLAIKKNGLTKHHRRSFLRCVA